MLSEVWCISCPEFFVLSIFKRQNTSIKHVALVGVTGVGKSTLVNVLVGSHRAPVNNDAEPCTTRRYPYDTNLGGKLFKLWDTRGLNEPRENEVTSALARFLSLIRSYASEDRELRNFLRGSDPKINLVIFCIEAKDIQGHSQWNNYRKVYKNFCKRRVKIVVVVTKLDQQIHGRDWRKKCMVKVREVTGGSPDLERFTEAVPVFHQRPEDMEDCRNRILKLVSSLI